MLDAQSLKFDLIGIFNWLLFPVKSERTIEFINAIDHHRQKALSIYGKAQSDQTAHFHVNKLKAPKAWDQNVQNTYPDLFEKYLTRYV